MLGDGALVLDIERHVLQKFNGTSQPSFREQERCMLFISDLCLENGLLTIFGKDKQWRKITVSSYLLRLTGLIVIDNASLDVPFSL